MFRFSLIVGVTLIFGITAKPHKPVNTFSDEAFQDTVMSIGEDGKMSWGVQVEPPEDKEDLQFNVDPRMKIWKSMRGGGGQEVRKHLKAEEDLDERHHPSMADLLQVQIMDALPAAGLPEKFVQPEEDRDDMDHLVFEVVHEEPEQDSDEVYHKAREELDGYLAPLVAGYEAGAEVQVLYSEPEEDLDDLYHKDLLLPVSHQEDAGAAPADLPSQMKHTEPEEDLDHLYHQ